MVALQTSGFGRQNTATQVLERSGTVHTASGALFGSLNCRTLLHMHTGTCMCRALLDLRAAPGDGRRHLAHGQYEINRKSQAPKAPKKNFSWVCVHCVVRSSPPLQFVVSARSIIVMHVLMPTLCAPPPPGGGGWGGPSFGDSSPRDGNQETPNTVAQGQ